MMRIWLLGSVLLWGSFCAAPLRADDSGAASAASVRVLMDLTGAGALGVQAFNQMLPQLRQMVPNAPASFWEEIAAEADADELVELIVPIYQRHFTEAEVQGLITFYRSPAGRSFVEKLPRVTQESMEAGNQWGQALAKRIIERAQAAAE